MKSLTGWPIVLLAFATELCGPDCLAQRSRHRDGAATSNPPSASLAPLVKKIGGMLMLHHTSVSAPGQITVLRGNFVAERANAAPERQQVLNAAIIVCDLITKALDERRQTEANAKATKAVRVTPSTKGRKKKNEAKQADAIFDQAIISFWENRKTELMNQINAAYSRLQYLEAQPPPAK